MHWFNSVLFERKVKALEETNQKSREEKAEEERHRLQGRPWPWSNSTRYDRKES